MSALEGAAGMPDRTCRVIAGKPTARAAPVLAQYAVHGGLARINAREPTCKGRSRKEDA
jgi:hypothetical protein